MALIYAPINGSAGTVTIDLVDRQSAESFSSVTINVINFDEEDEESEFTEIFTNINDETIKDYYGFKKRISFGLVNGVSGTGGILDANNLENILNIVSILNLANSEPLVYQLNITYRTGTNGTINDVIQIGNFKLEEVSAKSNAGQIINLEFKSRLSSNLKYSVDDYNDYLVLEVDNDYGHILLESGGKLRAETYTIT
jgi:hypothetical protein